MSEVLDASRVCSGTYGKIYRDGKWDNNVNECTADVEVDMKTIITCGGEWEDNKKGAYKGTGNIKGYKVTSDMIKQGFKPFELLTELDDPESYGAERIRLLNCKATKISLVNYKAGDICETETPFVFSGYELVDPIEVQ